jgi:flagellar biosynthesis protein FliR
MIDDPQGTVLALFAIFCRIGSCFMVLPGFSSARIPVMLRLMLAVAISFSLAPILWNTVYPKVSDPGSTYISLVFVEGIIGIVFGMIARFFVLGLEFTGTVITMMVGFSAPPAADVLEDGSQNQLTNMISFAGLLVLFIMDFHHVLILALADSYRTVPLGGVFEARRALVTLTDTLSQTFMVMLRLSSPFIVYGFLFNMAIGFVNKMSPQMPIYFISTPFIIMGGLFLFYFGVISMLHLFAEAFMPIFSSV